jgi:hypothetical protein
MRPTDPTSAAEAVLDLFRDQCRWMVEGQANLLDGILADSFTAQHVTGFVSPKTEWIGQVRSGDFVYHSIRDEGTTVEIQDGSATVVSRGGPRRHVVRPPRSVPAPEHAPLRADLGRLEGRPQLVDHVLTPSDRAG